MIYYIIALYNTYNTYHYYVACVPHVYIYIYISKRFASSNEGIDEPNLNTNT